MALFRFAFPFLLALAAGAAQAQIAFRAAASSAVAGPSTIAYGGQGAAANRGNCGNISPGLPAGVAAGDLLVAVVSAGAQPTITMAGWNQLLLDSGAANETAAIFWRIAAGGDPTTINQAGTCNVIIARVSRFTGVDTASPFVTNPLAAGNWSYQNANSVTSGTQTTTFVNAMLVMTAHSTDDDTFGALAGYTQAYTSATGTGNDAAIALYYALQATPATFGPYNVTKNRGADPNHGVLFALRPAGVNLTVNVPAGTAANDVMIASITVRPCSTASGNPCTSTVTAPAGWTLQSSVDQTTGGGTGGFGHLLRVYSRVASGAEPANYTWTLGGTPVHAGAAGGIAGFSGVNTSSPVVVQAGQPTASAFTHAAPAIDTGGVTNTMLVSTHTANSSGTWTPPPESGGMTEVVDRASLTVPNDLGVELQMNYQANSAAGPTGVRTATQASPPTADTGATHMLALRPNYTHYAVSYPGGGNFATCEPALVRIEAHHPGHGLAAPPAGTLLTINTSTADGVWLSPVVTGTNANWTPSGLNNGQATYQWNGGESVLEVRLRRNSAGSLNLNLSDSNARSEDGAEDPTLTYANSVLRITADGASSTNVNTQIAGKRNSEGAGIQTLFVQAVATAPATGACTTLFQNQTRSIEFAAVCNNPATCSALAGTEFEVRNNVPAMVSIAKNPNTVTQATASYTSVPLNFSNDANAMAPLVFRYGDAGQMTLFLRYTLPSPPAASTILGSSNAFVVRPFGIAIRGANAGTAIAHSSTDAGTVLAAAGDPFTMTLAAYKWQSTAEDANADGIPDFALPDVVDITDNGLTPNFAATTSVNAGSNLPGIATGQIRRGVNCPAGAATVAAGSWSGGAATITDFCYTEAGNVQVAALAVDYITAGVNIIGLSSYDGSGFTGGHVGRFRPKHFAVSAGTLANRHGAACAPASTFTYLDEPLQLSFTLTAQNAQNATTQNYNGTYAKLGLTTFGNWSLGARSGTTNLTSRLDGGVAPTGSWSNGVATGVVITTAVNRATPDNPDGPFTATAFGIAPSDSDGVAMNTLDLDVDNNAVMDRKNIGVSGELRFGRLRVNNALGSAKLALPVPLRLEYWNGTAFAVNTADSCTTLARNTIALGSYTGALAPGGGNCKTFIQQDPLNFTAGLATATLAAPTGAVSGSVLLTPQLRSPAAAGFSCDNASSGEDALASAGRDYLLGRWNDAANPDADANTSYDDNPAGRAGFGLYGSQPNNYIYFRENH